MRSFLDAIEAGSVLHPALLAFGIKLQYNN